MFTGAYGNLQSGMLCVARRVYLAAAHTRPATRAHVAASTVTLPRLGSQSLAGSEVVALNSHSGRPS